MRARAAAASFAFMKQRSTLPLAALLTFALGACSQPAPPAERRNGRFLCDNPHMSDELSPTLLESLGVLDPQLATELKDALLPVAGEIGDREEAVLQRLANGIATGAKPAELNAFVRLLPVTVSRAVQPVIEPVIAAT